MPRIVAALLLLLCAGAANAGERLTVDEAVAAALRTMRVSPARGSRSRRGRRASMRPARSAFPL